MEFANSESRFGDRVAGVRGRDFFDNQWIFADSKKQVFVRTFNQQKPY
ncbi:MAG: hypothetical protein WBA89_07910 [Microcoleus sp.]